jgi:hypothetical protein
VLPEWVRTVYFRKFAFEEFSDVLVGVRIVTEIVSNRFVQVVFKYAGDMGLRTTCDQETKGVRKMGNSAGDDS